jgi:hypothetical protein
MEVPYISGKVLRTGIHSIGFHCGLESVDHSAVFDFLKIHHGLDVAGVLDLLIVRISGGQNRARLSPTE